MSEIMERLRSGGMISRWFDSIATWPVIRGGLGFSAILTTLGLLFYTVWVITGGGAVFLVGVAALFGLLVVYSYTHSRSIEGSVSYFRTREGILLLVLLVALSLVLIVFSL